MIIHECNWWENRFFNFAFSKCARANEFYTDTVTFKFDLIFFDPEEAPFRYACAILFMCIVCTFLVPKREVYKFVPIFSASYQKTMW
jgi:hypothetical protein